MLETLGREARVFERAFITWAKAWYASVTIMSQYSIMVETIQMLRYSELQLHLEVFFCHWQRVYMTLYDWTHVTELADILSWSLFVWKKNCIWKKKSNGGRQHLIL